MADETVLTLVADIVSAHVSNNDVNADQLPQLITSVYGALSALGQPMEEPSAELKPAVSIRSSVKKDAIACLECGKKLKTLKRHLATDHNLTIEEYRSRWLLPSDYPTVAADYTEKRKELAQKIGLGRKGRKAKAAKANAAAADAAQSAPKVTEKAPTVQPIVESTDRKSAPKKNAKPAGSARAADVAESPKPKRASKAVPKV